MLTKIINMPMKFLIDEYKSEEDVQKGIEEFDKEIRGVHIPTMLLERLKKEFDQSYKIAGRSNNESIELKQTNNNNVRHSSAF